MEHECIIIRAKSRLIVVAVVYGQQNAKPTEKGFC